MVNFNLTVTEMKHNLVVLKQYIYCKYLCVNVLWCTQVKVSMFRGGRERAWVVFDAPGRSATTWFKCSNILYSSYTDLPDPSLPDECPGR